MLVFSGLVVSGTTASAVADDLRPNCCTDLKEQAAEPAPDLSIPLPSASYLGRKRYDEPSSVEGFFDTWASIARAAKASQPHWITPLATVTPRLEQEFRYEEFTPTRVPTSESMMAAKALSSYADQ